MSKPIRIATRGSALALWQANHIKQLLGDPHIELLIVETQGDRERQAFSQMSGQGFFTKAVQEAVLEGRADLAVHSHKDLPSAPTIGLELAAIPQREDPRELLLIQPEFYYPDAPYFPLTRSTIVGTSAVRRQAQLKQVRPGLEVRDLRGNVPTRVEKLRRGEYQAIVVARAGVNRLKLDLSGLEAVVLEPAQMVPAPAQGALAVECRSGEALLEQLRAIDHPETRLAVSAERGLMARLAGGCQLALGAYATHTEDGLELLAWYGGQHYRGLGQTPEESASQVYEQIRLAHPDEVAP